MNSDCIIRKKLRDPQLTRRMAIGEGAGLQAMDALGALRDSIFLQ